MANEAELKALREMRRWLSRQSQDASDLAHDTALTSGERTFARGEWVGYMRALTEIDERITEARKTQGATT